MANNSLEREEEINLIELMLRIWDGKWKILTIIIISIIFMIINIYLSTQNKNYFTASTDVQPISTFEENSYIAFNNLVSFVNQKQNQSKNIDVNENEKPNTIEINSNYFSELEFYKLSKSNLFKVYLELLKDKKLFEDGIRKYNLLDINEYINEQQYDLAIINLASSIKILLNKADDKNSFENIGAQIQIKYNNVDKWKRVLTYVDEQANNLIRQNLIKHFDTLLLAAQSQKDHKLEDVATEINNLIIDYEGVIATKLVFLEEHLQIAKKLGLEKNTIEMQPDFTNFSALAIVKPDSPYYLRGYGAIEKEIELIKNRENIKPFIPELLTLERTKRAIQQDKSLIRIKSHLLSTPLHSDQTFYAASINTLATKFVFKKEQHKKKLVLAGVIGLILGIFYVIIENAFKSIKSYRSK